jgi:hypothetical protein
METKERERKDDEIKRRYKERRRENIEKKKEGMKEEGSVVIERMRGKKENERDGEKKELIKE